MMAFLGKVKEGINMGVATVGVRSREVLDATMLKSQIDALSKRKRNAVAELGDIVYALFLKGAIDEETLRSRCMAVVSLDGQRLEKEERLRQIRLKSNDVFGGPISNAPCTPGNDIIEGTGFCTNSDKRMEVPEECSPESSVCPDCGPPHPIVSNLSGTDDALPQGLPTPQESEFDHSQTENFGMAPQGKEPIEPTACEDETEVVVCPTYGAGYSLTAGFCIQDRDLSEGGAESPSPNRETSNPTSSDAKPHLNLKRNTQETHSRKWGRFMLVAIILLAGSAGSYLFYTGYMARNPKAAEAQLNKELSAKGLSVNAVIGKDWTAAVTGSVRSHEEKESAIAIVKSHKLRCKEVSDGIVSQEDVRALKEKLSGVVQDMLALKNAIITHYVVDKHLADAADAPVIEKTYGIFVPETYAAFSIKDDGTINTTIRNIAGEVNDRTLQLKPSPDLTIWRWASDIDATYLPFRTGDEITEVIPSPPHRLFQSPWQTYRSAFGRLNPLYAQVSSRDLPPCLSHRSPLIRQRWRVSSTGPCMTPE